jgi:enterochelin esterase-like enzyme
LVATGGFGVYRYARSYWVYRGFRSPIEPTYTTTVGANPKRVLVQAGTVDKIIVSSRLVAPKGVWTEVLLPPGYGGQPSRRYPVLYFLHGLPGESFTYRTVLQGGTTQDILVAQRRMKPMIVVIPGGPWRTDTEWADGVGTAAAWDTFVSRDLVLAIDRRFRTIRSAHARAIGGLSEGGFGALNIGLHHPDIFGVIESWSGYTVADPKSAVFGKDPARLAYNSPLAVLPAVASELRRRHTYIWSYVGTADLYFHQNEAFANELARLGISHEFFSAAGGHSWPLWRRNVGRSLIVASEHMSHVSA